MSPRIKIITSFSEHLWNKYAKICLESWVSKLMLSKESLLEVWINGPFPRGLPTTTNSGLPISYRMLDTQSDSWNFFVQKFRHIERPNTQPGQEFRFNFIPFSCKVFALAESVYTEVQKETQQPFDYFVWLDADVLMTNTVTEDTLESFIGNHSLAWLDRGQPWGHGETGFMMVRNQDDAPDIFLQQANMWGSGQLFYMREWHDAFTFTSLVRLKEYMEAPNFTVRNLNQDVKSEVEQGLYPFKTSPLAPFMTHYKGNTKDGLTNQT